MNSLLENKDHSTLQRYIESLRKEMIRVGLQEGLTSEKTIKLSQKLDLFIAKYQKLNKII